MMWMLAARETPTSAAAAAPRFIPLTFRNGTVSAARFAPDGETVIYSAAWGGQRYGLFMTRRGSPESRLLDIPDARLLSVSSSGDLALLRGHHDAVRLLLPSRTGILARVALTGGAPRELLTTSSRRIGCRAVTSWRWCGATGSSSPWAPPFTGRTGSGRSGLPRMARSSPSSTAPTSSCSIARARRRR